MSKGTMFGFFFSQKPVRNFADAKAADHAQFARLHGLLLEQGIYLAPSQYETNFMSSAHTQADLDQTLAAFEQAFQKMKEEANG
ncbi:Glutamate-1-semialdehyde aminotransferase [Streptococcus sp. DD11]|nr:Glutamate-1-semialdehyde aminotransferase [Streptococcus sp. DD11]